MGWSPPFSRPRPSLRMAMLTSPLPLMGGWSSSSRRERRTCMFSCTSFVSTRTLWTIATRIASIATTRPFTPGTRECASTLAPWRGRMVSAGASCFMASPTSAAATTRPAARMEARRPARRRSITTCLTSWIWARPSCKKKECNSARETTKKIIKMMYIPLIQGAMRYAYKVSVLQGKEVEKAEGSVFTAAVLPRIHAASPEAAKIIYDNMKVGASSTDHVAVKQAFESTYASLGITCEDVGGLYFEAENKYYEGMEPCVTGAAPAGGESSGLRVGIGAVSSFSAAVLMYFFL